MKKTILLLLMVVPFMAFAQTEKSAADNDPTEGEPFLKRTTLEGGIMLSSNGDLTTISLNGMQYWGLGNKNRKFKLGAGVRLNSNFGNDNLEYITADGKITGDEANLDTLSLEGTQAISANLFIALRYDITERWGAEFNIDLAGFSFGGQKTGTLTYNEGNTLEITDATPAQGNVLLIGDNDIGNLNSEFFISYRYKSDWRFKLGAVYQFNEYMIGNVPNYTNSKGTVLQTQRYRSKNMTFGLGVNYMF